ncbi:MAG: hypothetical protein ACU84Q_17070 [Gammaproteobacteria bacterium]
MNWEAISGISDAVSALGVIGSLIYVGVQIKKNTLETRRSNARSTSHDHGAAIHAILQDENVAELILKGCDDLQSLTDVERYRYDLATLVWLQAIEQAFADIRQRDYPDDMEDTYKVMVPGVLNTPGGLEWWASRKPWFSAAFQKEVDELLANPPEEHTHAGVRAWPYT